MTESYRIFTFWNLLGTEETLVKFGITETELNDILKNYGV